MNSKKLMLDMTVTENTPLGSLYGLLKLVPTDGSPLPDIAAGQFVQVEVSDSKTTYLRRPISVNYVDYKENRLWLLIRKAGEGTRHLAAAEVGKVINVILPLGRGFGIDNISGKKVLLVGGGVGVAPLLYLGEKLKEKGITPDFLLGARSEKDLLQLDDFAKTGNVFTSTEDGSHGEKGLVTTNSAFDGAYDKIFCCGPMPMMKAVAAVARKKGVECEVSLENKMACGLGACLCCVEKKNDGHNVCVCTDGPVFNINELPW
ncbi:MAG: dihydroorotate dehydrogenase electron transfer subunit [Muribaculaceae bacterium]|nr:dihydroorotate dehydrogenase electron transfer subunit [Muribaculaceae bacterium]MDE6703332.1 dihydroorotate dehydrogenase electron transfer subunit [Muribaculaceae bacterium]